MAARQVSTRYPGVYRRGARYPFTWRDSRGKQRWSSAATLEGARRGKATKEAEVAAGAFDPKSRVLLGDYLPDWLANHQGHGEQTFRRDTRVNYTLLANRWLLRPHGYWPASTLMVDIDVPAVVRFLAWLCKQRTTKGTRPSQGTMKKILAPLSGAFRQARLEGLVQTNPVPGVPLPSAPARVIDDTDEGDDRRTVTQLQLQAFLAKAPVEHQLMFDVLAVTGLRVSELFGLDGRHLLLDQDRPVIRVRQAWRRGNMEPVKSRYGRRDIPIPLRLVAPLRALGRGPRQIVFPDARGDRLSDHSVRRQVLKPIARLLGFGWAGFHTFRHTCASMLFAAGYSIVQVQRWLGHHKPSFTLDTYVHLLAADLPPAFDPIAVRTAVQTGHTQEHTTARHLAPA